jgi:hypothetical protein
VAAARARAGCSGGVVHLPSFGDEGCKVDEKKK